MHRRSCVPLLVLAALGVAPAVGAQTNELAILRGYLDAWNGEVARLDDVLAPDFVDRTALLPSDANGLKAQIALWRRAAPDLRVTLVERVNSGTRAVVRLRFEGWPADPAAIVPLTGGALAIERTDWLTIADGRIAELKAVTDEWSLPPELAFTPPPARPRVSLPARTIARFPPGAFLESIAVAPDGRLFVSTGPEGAILIVGADGKVEPFARLAVGPAGLMMCLTFDPAGMLYASVISGDPALHGVWRFAPDGAHARLAPLPAASMPNGVALDGRGNLLVADTFGGLIWRVPLAGGEAREWIRHELLAPRPLVGMFPGADGLQRNADAIFVTVPDRTLLLRIGIKADGSAGAPEIISTTVPGDDFAVADDGTLYVTTHPFNTVIRLTPNGQHSIVAGPGEGVVGPTAAVIGRDGALYVVTDGGLYRPRAGAPLNPAVVRIELAP